MSSPSRSKDMPSRAISSLSSMSISFRTLSTSIPSSASVPTFSAAPQDWTKVWDAASSSKKTRLKILQNLVSTCQDSTVSDIEGFLGTSISLVFARVLSWTRVVANTDLAIVIPLKALCVLMADTSDDTIMKQFVQMDGVDIITTVLQQPLDIETKDALFRLIRLVLQHGRRMKELLCALRVHEAVVQFMMTESSMGVLETGRTVLFGFGNGNPLYLNDVLKCVCLLLGCPLEVPKSMAAQTLRETLERVKVTQPQYQDEEANVQTLLATVDAIMNAFKTSSDFSTHSELCEVLKQIAKIGRSHKTLQTDMLQRLLPLLPGPPHVQSYELGSNRFSNDSKHDRNDKQMGQVDSEMSRLSVQELQRKIQLTTSSLLALCAEHGPDSVLDQGGISETVQSFEKYYVYISTVKMIGYCATASQRLSEWLVANGALPGLICTLVLFAHVPLQREAASSLQSLCARDNCGADDLHRILGPQVYEALATDSMACIRLVNEDPVIRDSILRRLAVESAEEEMDEQSQMDLNNKTFLTSYAVDSLVQS
eukprot:GILK01011202.1.p1 GENE.GILK01011202.1~~GILK01011202.1.p1  ORF type:complete len:540 (-),score=102.04 GILK01011202.1:65-1684(-)